MLKVKQRIFEVERRFSGHLPSIPNGFEKKETYELIKDVYFSIEPQFRLRYMVRSDFASQSEINKMTLKRPKSREVIEYETMTGDFDTSFEILSSFKPPITYMSGKREYYSDGYINLFFDVISKEHRLKINEWTEVEIMVAGEHEIKNAEDHIMKLIKDWNVSPEKIEKLTYVEMKMGNLVHDAILHSESELPYTISTLAKRFECTEGFIENICTILESEKKILGQGGRFYPILPIEQNKPKGSEERTG